MHFTDLALAAAHDIRGPLAALATVTSSTASEEDKTNLLRLAVKRLNQVAEKLLTESRRNTSLRESSQAPKNPQLQSCLVVPLINEIILERRATLPTGIDLQLDDTTGGLETSLCEPAKFQSIVSNLVMNAAEAIEGTGSITVRVRSFKDILVVVIQDTGRGILPEVQERMFQKGASFGKANGNGLGLYLAKQTIESWAAKLACRARLLKAPSSPCS